MGAMKTYLVGGAVRDRLLGLEPGDRDWVVVGESQASMEAAGFKPVGRDFPVFLHPDTGEEYALARTERKSGRGYRGFVVDADPSVTLEEDLLRVLRAARFMARFAALGFSVAAETTALMRDIVASGELAELVPERVWQEMRRALASERPSAFVRTLHDCGALEVVLPEVEALYGVPQRAEYHPEVDTGVHVELVCDMAARLAPGDDLIGFAALTHDLGKAMTPTDVLPKHIGHEQAGVAPLRALCERLRIPTGHRQLAEVACREHLNVHRFDELRATTVVKLIERCDGFRKPDRIDRLATVCEADKRGRAGLQQQPYPQADALRAAHAVACEVRASDLPPGLEGPAIGEALRKARVAAVARATGRRP